jgi:hypothetical protein
VRLGGAATESIELQATGPVPAQRQEILTPFSRSLAADGPTFWRMSIPVEAQLLGATRMPDVRARHLLWVGAGGVVAFLTSFVFGDLLTLPLDLYYLIYFAVILGFLRLYIRRTGMDWRRWTSPRLGWAIVAGLALGVVMAANVLSRPDTERLTGVMLPWAVFWRGVVYGAVDGLLMFAFPWIVTWRAFDAESGRFRRKIGAAATAWLLTILVTTTYHLGYADFRSRKIIQPNIGSAMAAIPTIVTANPVASCITHVTVHVAAVLHSPYTELFLPPHRERAP